MTATALGQSMTFCDFALGTSYADIPASTHARAQDYLLDLIGVGAGACHIDRCRVSAVKRPCACSTHRIPPTKRV